jgi:hypothetical protein
VPTNTPLPTSTPTIQPTNTAIPPTPTYAPVPATSTPFPPKAAAAGSLAEYPGKFLGTLVIGLDTFQMYQGINAADGSLMLPSHHKGAALYQGTVWVHRMWGTGWVTININDLIVIQSKTYRVTSTSHLDYGKYPVSSSNIRYLASCYSDTGGWLGTQLYKLELIMHEH